ncbi:golgin candidate 5 [Impatiens glandulifera]|uniref:golgin candidate 5 n=1 Tax=Impatiens glandulifera TaxID=253017 RepID=UPI001FB0A8BB|nr:golgin candidate 5 [Impatiens glandulifera]
MAWFSGKVSLGNFPDFAGAVNKLSESVKNIEKNFDTALGLEEKQQESKESGSNEGSGLWPVMSFMSGNKDDESNDESGEETKSVEFSSSSKKKEEDESDSSTSSATGHSRLGEEVSESSEVTTRGADLAAQPEKLGASGPEVQQIPDEEPETKMAQAMESNPVINLHQDISAAESSGSSEVQEAKVETNELNPEGPLLPPKSDDNISLLEGENEQHLEEEVGRVSSVSTDKQDKQEEEVAEEVHSVHTEVPNEQKTQEEGEVEKISSFQPKDVEELSQTVVRVESIDSVSPILKRTEGSDEEVGGDPSNIHSTDDASGLASDPDVNKDDAIVKLDQTSHQASGFETVIKEEYVNSPRNTPSSLDSLELEKLRKEMKSMERALQGAAKQSQAKADEIARLMNENEHLNSVNEDLRRKSNEAEVESLREEYHQRVSALERKVYALTKERDTLRREQNKKSDAAALLKEKDEIISQVMAEGEELSKKQAAQEATIRKLRAQIREFEEEKKGLSTKLQVEENKVESIKRDKSATEKLLQETIEKHQVELAAQKEFYTNALNAAKEAEALAEARANNEARTELESHLREAMEREAVLVRELDELRQTLTRSEQQASFREDMLRRDIEDLQKRYQASERRCEELITQVPESTRPLLRQIEAMQETIGRRAEAWTAVERSLTTRLQEAEAKSAGAEERERSVNERMMQTLSRINVLEAQISCLRTEQTQLSRSLEKERQRAAESRQEFLAAKEESETHVGRATQLEEEIRELRRKHKQELQESLAHQELLQQEIDREKVARLELERKARLQSSAAASEQSPVKSRSAFENGGNLPRKLSSATSLGSIEESFFLQASLDSSDSIYDRRNSGDTAVSPYFLKSMTPSAFEAALRQKEGELASYMSRLASMDSIRDSLAEELVKMTAECEKLRVEASMLPGIRAELEALRRRHSAALELMGERDEELEELRADIVDMKEMYREQVNMLVNKIQSMGLSVASLTR